jgi:nucleotide-binding universal stress UspA family protein
MSPKQRLDILLADDGSLHAQAAVELLQDIPLPSKSRILVHRAFSSGQIPWVSDFEHSLERTKDQLSSRDYRVETDLQLGSAAETILGIAEERKPGLIILGAKGLRSTVSILLGGVAQQVIEYACCPVLIVRAPYRGLSKILMVTDGSPSSQSAARFLAKFPLPKGVEVHVMHVLPPIYSPLLVQPYMGAWQTMYVEAPTPQEDATARKKELALGENILRRTCMLLQRGGIEVKTVLGRGDAATEIMDYVKKHSVDLIVAGSRGFGQFKSLWMGSVSRKLVHYSDCSVLVVKQPRKE